ncbi:RAVE protein 1 C terminal family protein [Candida albicans]|uniref:RAVE protein 1 C terminal family protein n=1 Tax=Candida albicans TaxID=5476 RepID=A0A8H6C4N1_CANAX|nr:RAVE protein 1 C terminal family protein [Candida albicans]
MTITFIPGEVNKSNYSVAHSNWKNHHIIAYGSGNNLIITDKSLQTIYLDRDPSAIDINPENGYILVSIESKILVYKPMNEYMKIPKWQSSIEIDVNESTINCIKWASEENEIVEYGELKYRKRWQANQVNPVTEILVTPNSKMIMTKSGSFDRLIKVWTRISYGDENTLFEVTYLPHPQGTFVIDYHLKKQITEEDKKNEIDASMANIKNIRDYINNATDEGEINNWATLDLKEVFSKISTVIVIENYHLRETLIPALKNSDCTLFNGLDINDLDLLFVVSDTAEVKIYAITNISQCPPTKILFTPISGNYHFGKNEYPLINTQVKTEKISSSYIESEEFITTVLKPLLVKEICILNERVPFLTFLLHDRVKNTLRFNIMNIEKLARGSKLESVLINKYQGHTKSIRKLVKSNSSFSQNNVLLSISNFPQHNYIWEPMLLQTNTMSVTKRFQINVESGIVNAVIINDAGTTKLVFGIVMALLMMITADLITKVKTGVEKDPLVFVLTEYPDNTQAERKYCVVALYAHDQIKSWKLSLHYKQNKITDILFDEESVASLPQEEEIYQATAVDAFVSEANKSLIAVISKNGLLKSYSLNFDESIRWKKVSELETNVSAASKIHGSTVINKFAVVDSTGYKLSIWDVMQGVLEYEETFPESNGPVTDLDWTFLSASKMKSTSNALLSVGFSRFVLLYTQLHGGYLIIGAGNQFFIDDRWVKLGSSAIDSTIRQLMIRVLNGPLPIFHPQFVIQALFIMQFTAVKKILVQLFQVIRRGDVITWDLNTDVENLFRNDEIYQPKRRMSLTLDTFTEFNNDVADLLIERLMKISLPLLTRHQQSTLISTIVIVKDFTKDMLVELDPNGIRYLISLKLSSTATATSTSSATTKKRLAQIQWAMMCKTPDILLEHVTKHYGGKIKWKEMKDSGMPFWVEKNSFTKLFEKMAALEFKDAPLGRISSNRSSALKNAYVLLGLHRYLDAAYFFLLADAPKDCCRILADKVDSDLAVAVAKVYGVEDIAENQLSISNMDYLHDPILLLNSETFTNQSYRRRLLEFA